MVIYKICSCGNKFTDIPKDAKIRVGKGLFSGLWFDCPKCKSSLFMNTPMILGFTLGSY